MAKTKNGRDYFFENFVDIDFINQYYKEAIVTSYAPRIGNLNIERNKTDFVFAKGIEFIANVKASKKKEAIQSSYALFQKVSIHMHWQELIHPYPYARLISVYLISEYLKNQLTIDKITFSIEKIETVLFNTDNTPFVLAQIIMALNYCECYQEVINIYEKYKNSINSSKFNFDYNYNSIINCVNTSKEYLNIPFKERSFISTYAFEQKCLSINNKKPLF